MYLNFEIIEYNIALRKALGNCTDKCKEFRNHDHLCLRVADSVNRDEEFKIFYIIKPITLFTTL